MLDNLNSILPDVFRVIDLIGVFVNGIIGGQLARRRNFDAVGFFVLAVMSGLGGGIVRDVMLQSGAPVAITDPYYLFCALGGAFVAILLRLSGRWATRMVFLGDGLVLGCWAATGTLKTLSLGYNIPPAILLGLVTAVGGGMIRDVASGMVPRVFGGNTLYATPALAASLIMVVFYKYDQPVFGMLVAIIFGGLGTVVSGWRRWTLPTGDWTVTIPSKQFRALLARKGVKPDVNPFILGGNRKHRPFKNRKKNTGSTAQPTAEEP